MVREQPTPHCFGGKAYLGFEHITWVPFQLRLLDLAMLSPAERAWIDQYHADCRARLAPQLQEAPSAVQRFLHRATAPLPPAPLPEPAAAAAQGAMRGRSLRAR